MGERQWVESPDGAAHGKSEPHGAQGGEYHSEGRPFICTVPYFARVMEELGQNQPLKGPHPCALCNEEHQ